MSLTASEHNQQQLAKTWVPYLKRLKLAKEWDVSYGDIVQKCLSDFKAGLLYLIFLGLLDMERFQLDTAQ